MRELFLGLSLQGQHHQQEFPHDFDDSVPIKDDNLHASVNNEPKHEYLLRTKPLIDDCETTNIKDVKLDHGATQTANDEKI